MSWNFREVYSVFSTINQELLLDGKWGVEREAQRVTATGDLALTPHPASLGDKLRNKEITTDFSESQLELITPAFSSVEEVDRYMKGLYRKAAAAVGNELLWPLSMPPRLPEEDMIPIASFDDSGEGHNAYTYRQGLASRYGKKMQMISGIHFNFSYGRRLLNVMHQKFGVEKTLAEYTDDLYFSVARNYLRYHWLLIYLFGASPSFDETYGTVINEELVNIKRCCPECCNQYEVYATSLRVSRYGYRNPKQGKSQVFYNSKEEYIRIIRSFLSKKSRVFAKLDVQLNDKILQKESEFYSPIRLKQITGPGESQLDALEKRGVEYAEARIFDIDPYEKTGISLEQLHFLQVFMLYCMFEENKPIDGAEMKRINKNHHLAAMSGRKPDLKLYRQRKTVDIKEWGKDIFDRLLAIAELLDYGKDEKIYSACVNKEYRKLEDIALLPSAIIQTEMRDKNESFIDFGIRKAKEYRQVGLAQEH